MALEVYSIGENVVFGGQSMWSNTLGVVINTPVNMSATGLIEIVLEKGAVESVTSYSVSYASSYSNNPGQYFGESLTGENRIAISFGADPGIIPMEKIQYVDPNRNLQTISGWGELPAPSQSPELTLMEENNISHIAVTATVTVSYLPGEVGAVEETESADFTLIIVSNYTISANLLTDEIQDRLPYRIS